MTFKELIDNCPYKIDRSAVKVGWDASRESTIDECAEIVKRHKNSPSIIYWNEACESIEKEILNLKEDK